MGKYAKIMAGEWKNRLLYFASGDKFQGGLKKVLKLKIAI